VTKKKILFVITKSNWGGAQRYVFDLATHLPKDQFDVAVTHGGNGLLVEKLRDAGIRTIQIKNFERNIGIIKDTGSFFELVSCLRRERPDIVHLNSSKAGGIGTIAARLAGVKNIIFTVHGWPFLENRFVALKVFIWIASLSTALLCHKVICISEYDLQIAKRMPCIGGKAVRIYNGIAPMSFGSGEKIRNAFPPGVKITGTIGELTQNKNQIALIEEARNKPDMYVAIVGLGEDYTMLSQQIKKYGLDARVKLLGFIRASEALKGFDVFVLPSLKEGLPYVLLEAKAAGLPIIASRVGGVPEILDAKDLSIFSLQKMLEKTVALY